MDLAEPRGEHPPTTAGPDRHLPFLDRCLSIDLEVDPKTATVFALAAVRSDETEALVSAKGRLGEALDRLERSLDAIDHPIGHNILRHDIEHLVAARPRLAALMDAPIDTLWLNPLAFPRNPYHRLVKHYRDGRLQAGHVNDPVLDARLVFEVLSNQIDAFRAMDPEQPDAIAVYHSLTTRTEGSRGFDALFRHVRGANGPDAASTEAAIRRLLDARVCETRLDETLEGLSGSRSGWPLAYALSWILVAGGDSVMPPWVRAAFPEAADIVRHLRDTSCGSPDCGWCVENNDPVRALKRWFGFDAYRPEPRDAAGRSLQERIVDEAMASRSVLGILPTGTGKSVCYQVPALSRFDKTGALTVVISPLVALMADQVQGLARAGIASAVTINGMLSMPERQDALDKVRLGEASILIIAPEQLRSVSVRSVLAQREVGLWVLDEAHCVSKWGHDFRPDYRYIGRFVREFTGDATPAPVLCLTATAKPEVVSDVREHFRSRLGAELMLLDGGSSRTNLAFEVRPTRMETKLSDILDVIAGKLPAEGASGAVIYCATRKETERVADFLRQQGLAAEHYHAGLGPEEKRDIQERFRTGAFRIIAATNAFGMGIDKPDIRLVVHGDIPGSLENYLQEAGRAGRDREAATCVLLFAEDDVERQFSMSARSRLARHEIGAILKALRRIDERTRSTGIVVATSGEIVRDEKDRAFVRDEATDDTRVKTAVSWLEESALVSREENRVQVFPSSLLVRTVPEAIERLERADITGARRRALIAIVTHLMNAPPDQGISTDELCGAGGLSPAALNRALSDLEALGIARNDMALTVFVHVGSANASQGRLAEAARLEESLIGFMREAAPDADASAGQPLHLAQTCQVLRDAGHAGARPDIVEALLRGIARDGRDGDGAQGNVRVWKASRETLMVTLQRSWRVVGRTADLRRQAAGLLLDHLVGLVPKGVRGHDIQVETTAGDLVGILVNDTVMKASGARDVTKLMERCLLWLHEQGIVTLGKGLTVFRSAMTVHLDRAGGRFTRAHFQPLEEHYAERTIQTHVMAAYAETGIIAIDNAVRLSADYFVLGRDDFLRRWLPGRGAEVRKQATGASWRKIVEDLGNPVQQAIVSDDREQTNVLVLAGPGSGKTRVLVHRIAYLLRIKREDPREILVLAYNRHAAAEIRVRLRHLVGDGANGVTVSTCHALAMRIVGASFADAPAGVRDFDGIVREAVRLLEGQGLSRAEAEAQRDALIQGYRWILVDEYQDIGPEEYALIAAVAGRSLEDPDLRLSLFAVGDDDQNIYAFAGASVAFIRRFEEEYRARPEFLVENYRSTAAIVEASNAVIAGAGDRMKAGHDIAIDAARAKLPAGGVMTEHDPVAQGRVQLLDCPGGDMPHAVAAVDELLRLSRLDPNWSWARTAIIAREWRRLAPARSYAEQLGLPVEMANEAPPPVWRLREMQAFVAALRAEPSTLHGVPSLLALLNRQPANRWTDLIAEGIAALAQDLGSSVMPVSEIVEWFADWARDTRGEQRGLLLLTAHRAKGLEFDHVVLLDGGWDRTSRGEDADAPRRLFYVGMTRARSTLAVTTTGEHRFLSRSVEGVLHRRVHADPGRALPQDETWMLPGLAGVDLSYAGRLGSQSPTLAAIAEAQVGDAIDLVRRDGRWVTLDGGERVLGRMAQAWKPPEGQAFLWGQVGAIVRWRKADNEEKYRGSIRREAWETVLPEMVFGRDVGP